MIPPHGNGYEYIGVKSPQIVKEIVSANKSHSNTKPSTPTPTRSFSIDVTDSSMNSTKLEASSSSTSSSNHSSSSSSAFKLTHPSRKYFDSGDYELARAGILSSASVGSIHPSADKLLLSSASRSAKNSRDEISVAGNEQLGLFCRNLSAPNHITNLQKSTFSMASLDELLSENELEDDHDMMI